MQNSNNVDTRCASALLDAWCRNDSAQMRELAAAATTGMERFYASNPAESERMELIGAIATELHRTSAQEKRQDADPYVRLLLRLVNADRRAHSN